MTAEPNSERASSVRASPRDEPDPVDPGFMRSLRTNIQRMLLSPALELPRVSAVASRIIRLAGDPDADIERVVDLVQSDPQLATRLLSLVNSAAHATRQEVTSVRHAIVLLGLKSVGDLLFCASMRTKIFSAPAYTALMTDLWTHGVACAAATDALCQSTGAVREPGFLGGLLHDIGKPMTLSAIVATEREGPRRWPIGENAAGMLLDQLHLRVGDLLARRWRLSPEIQEAIRSHHEYRPGMPRLAHLVYCGNRIVHHLGLGCVKQPLTASLDPAFVDLALTSPDELGRIGEEVTNHVSRLRGSL